MTLDHPIVTRSPAQYPIRCNSFSSRCRGSERVSTEGLSVQRFNRDYRNIHHAVATALASVHDLSALVTMNRTGDCDEYHPKGLNETFDR